MDENRTYNNTVMEEDEISLYEIFSILVRKKFLICLFFVVFVALAVGYIFIATPIYEADATMMVTPLNQSSAVSSLLEGFSSSSSKITTEVELLTSRRNIENALSLLDLSSYYDKDGLPYTEREFTAAGIAEHMLTITSVKDTNIVKIIVSDPSPEFAQDFANAICDSYNSILTDYAKDSTQSQLEFVESQIPLNRVELEKATSALAAFQRDNRMMQVTQESQIELAKYNYLKNRMAPVSLEIGEAEAVISVIEGVPTYEEILADESVRALMKDISSASRELLMFDLLAISTGGGASSITSMLNEDQLSRYYTLSQNMTGFERNLTDRIRTLSTVDGISSQTYAKAMTQKVMGENEIAILTAEADNSNVMLEKLPELQRQLAELQSDVEVYQTMEVSLLQMKQEANLYNASITDNVTEIDRAALPEEPVSPQKAKVLLVAGFLGLAMGIGLSIILEFNDKTICSVEDLKKILPSETPVLGWIPMLKPQRKERYLGSVVLNNPTSFEAERYKLIASTFIFNQKKGDKHRVVTVCSDDKNEGKTSVMANVAVSLTQNGYKVLLVDGDLRMPSCEQFFKIEHQVRGLCDIIMEGENINNCIVQPIAEVDNLHLLPCGTKPLIPSVIYSHENFASLIETVKDIYDIVLFDAPPLEYASELLSLVRFAPEVIIVSRAGISNKLVLAELIETLSNAGAKIAGVCLNALIFSNGTKSGYGYGYSNKDKAAMASIMKRIPFYSSRKVYYRKRYKRDTKYRNKDASGVKIRPIHPYAPDLDV